MIHAGFALIRVSNNVVVQTWNQTTPPTHISVGDIALNGLTSGQVAHHLGEDDVLIESYKLVDLMIDITPPTIAQIETGRSQTYDGTQLVDAPIFADLTTDQVKTALKAYAASARWAKEVGGAVVGGVNVDTSRESRSLIEGAYQEALYNQSVSGWSLRFKGASGWATMTSDQVIGFCVAIGSFVQACFVVESDLDTAIDAGTVTTVAEIDAAFAALSNNLG